MSVDTLLFYLLIFVFTRVVERTRLEAGGFCATEEYWGLYGWLKLQMKFSIELEKRDREGTLWKNLRERITPMIG